MTAPRPSAAERTAADRLAAHRLAADLRAADFTVDALGALWGADAASALDRGQRVPARRAVARTSSPLATLATAFVLGLSVPPDDLARALPSCRLEGALALGLVTAEGSPLLDLRPYELLDEFGVAAWWIASDLGETALGHPIPEDHVLGVGRASSTLAGLMVPRRVESALDLGTGSGIQALHASRIADRVVATDISDRALALAALNADLNGIESIEFRRGDRFEPVAGERFDLIVSNPPFVITPRTQGVPAYVYRDGGLAGDALVESIVRGLADHLAPGGIAQLLGNWEYGADDGLARALGWVSRHLDAWIIERERQSIEQYAETWIRDGGTRPGADFDRLYEAWLDDLAARGVTGVGLGYLTIRDPGPGIRSDARRAAPLRRVERLTGPIAGGLGGRIAESLEAIDLLAGAHLADAVLTVAPDVTEQRHYWPGDEHPTAMELRQGGGFGRVIPVGTTVAAVVGACDGTLSVGAICDAVAELLEVDPTELRNEVLPELRELVFVGMLRF